MAIRGIACSQTALQLAFEILPFRFGVIGGSRSQAIRIARRMAIQTGAWVSSRRGKGRRVDPGVSKT